MPKKLSSSANKNIPTSENKPATDSPTSEEQLTVSDITNTEISPETLGTSPLTTPLTDAVSWPAMSGKAKAQPAQRSWAAVASGGAASSSNQTQAPKVSWSAITSGEASSTSKETATTSSQIQVPQKSWSAIASGEAPFASTKSRAPTTSWAAMASAQAASSSKALTPFITESQKIKAAEIFNELETLNPNDKDYFKKITTVIYKIRNLKINLTDSDKLKLIAFVSNLNLKPWSNMNFVHLFISLKYSSIFDKEIPQDTEKKQAQLFKKLVGIAEEVINDPSSYHRAGLYSLLSQVIKLISTSGPWLLEPNKDVVKRSLKAFIGYIERKEEVRLNPENTYKLATSFYDLSVKDIITQQEAIVLARPYVANYSSIIKGLKNPRQQNSYLFACRHLMINDHECQNHKNNLEALFNKSIELIDPFSSDPQDTFYLFDEVHYSANMKLIDIENCNLEPLMKRMEGKIHAVVDKPLFAKLYINLYNLETTSFAKTSVYKRLKKEFHTCLRRNINRIDPASLARIEAFMAKSKVSYLDTDELESSVTDNLELMLNRICSSTSILNRENCLASLNIFSHKMSTDIHLKHFEDFKSRIIPILLSQYSKLTYNEKIQLIRVLPLTKNEIYDQKCKEIITELHATFTANPEQYRVESALFLSAITKLGNYNSDIIPFIELSRKTLVIDETCSKLHLLKSLKFYSFAYAYFILQEQEKSFPQQQINSVKEEMKEKLILAINFIESQNKGSLLNDDKLLLNYGYALLGINKHHHVNFVYTETNIQREIYNALAKEYQLEKEKDIRLEASLFGLPGVDIYLNKFKLALEIDGKQHYQGANSTSVSGKSLIQKAILNINGIHLINITNLTRRRSIILEEVKSQINDYLRKKEADLTR